MAVENTRMGTGGRSCAGNHRSTSFVTTLGPRQGQSRRPRVTRRQTTCRSGAPGNAAALQGKAPRLLTAADVGRRQQNTRIRATCPWKSWKAKNRFPASPRPRRLRTTFRYGIRILRASSMIICASANLVQESHQAFAGRRHRRSAITDNLDGVQRLSVKLLVHVIIRFHRSATQ